MNRPYRLQSGVSAILAVFILVLFALLGTYMLTQFTTTSVSATSSYLGMQGWLAARSGTEWGIFEALHGSGCAASTVLTVDDFTVTVKCTATPVTEGPDNYTVYDLTSTAVRGSPGETLYVSRRVTTSFTDI